MALDKAFTIFTDGGARGNPGPAGVGYLIYDSSGVLVTSSGEYIGEATNNFAEYTALIKALEAALKLDGSRVSVNSDSELMVKQLNGEYRVKHPDLIPLHAQVRQLAAGLASFEIQHVRREKNKEADRLVNAAVDAHLANRGPAAG